MTSEHAQNKPARDEKGRLLPGQTANPGGRPKDLFRVREMVAARGDDIINKLFGIAFDTPEMMLDEGRSPLLEMPKVSDRLKALELLLAYWVGRPIAALEVSTPEGKRLDIAGARAAAAELLKDPEARKAIRMAAREGT